MEIARDRYVEQLKMRQGNGFVKIITGIRRCGKSYLLNTLFYNALLAQGVKKSKILRFAFDSARDLSLIGEDLMEIAERHRNVSPQKFISYIQGKIRGKGVTYILLDEVQLLGNFEAVLNGFLREEEVDVYVTGSNSRFLSKDVLTEFAGRGDEVHMLPLSFSEFRNAYVGSVDEALDEYMLYGGLPQVVLLKSDEQKAHYLDTQMKNVYVRDVVARYRLQGDKNISELLDVLSSGISSLVNARKLANTFRSVKGESVCEATIAHYIECLEEGFLVKRAFRYDIKGKKYIQSPYKVYFEDMGLRNARLGFRQVERTHIMENVVYNELRYRGYQVDVGEVEVRSKQAPSGKEERRMLEIDFVANKGFKRLYLQCAYRIADEEKWHQETNSFEHTKDSFRKIVVVLHPMKHQVDDKGYEVIGINEFLCGDEWE